MDGWVGHVGWQTADELTTKWSPVQLAVWRRIGIRLGLWSFPNKEPSRIAGARFLQARCPSCHPTNGVKELKGYGYWMTWQFCPSRWLFANAFGQPRASMTEPLTWNIFQFHARSWWWVRKDQCWKQMSCAKCAGRLINTSFWTILFLHMIQKNEVGQNNKNHTFLYTHISHTQLGLLGDTVYLTVRPTPWRHRKLHPFNGGWPALHCLVHSRAFRFGEK